MEFVTNLFLKSRVSSDLSVKKRVPVIPDEVNINSDMFSLYGTSKNLPIRPNSEVILLNHPNTLRGLIYKTCELCWIDDGIDS